MIPNEKPHATVLIGIPCLKLGGTELQTLRLVQALVEGGYRVVTACYFEYDMEMVRQYQMAGSQVECLSAYGTRPNGTVKQYRFLKGTLGRVVKEYKPTIAHVQYMAPGALPIFILKRLGMKTILATLHTTAGIYKSLRLVHFLQRRYVKAFTCISIDAEMGFFGRWQLYDKNMPLRKRNHFTIYNTLAPKLSIAEPRCQFQNPITIGIVSRLETIKGVDLVIPAFAKLKGMVPNIRLVIVGEGTQKELMFNQQKQYGIEADWRGSVPQQSLSKIYEEIDIVWIPSRSEGFGLTAIEAMANGCMVIASETGGLPEVIDQKELLFEPENMDDLVSHTQRLLESDPAVINNQRRKLSQKVTQFTFEHFKESILDLYSRL